MPAGMMAGSNPSTPDNGQSVNNKKIKSSASTTPKIVKLAKRGQLVKLVACLDGGDPVNSADKERNSALFYAARNGHRKCLKELLRRGANPNQRNIDGQTPCHAAVLGGRPPQFPRDTLTIQNPVTGVCHVAVGCYNLLSYHVRDAKKQCRCLQQLVKFGGDLKIRSLTNESARDIAMRMRKMDILELIEDYLHLKPNVSESNICFGMSMTRVNSFYPHAFPHWMHTIAMSGTKQEKMSPLSSKASLFYKGRCRDSYDYGFSFSRGSRTNPGSFGGVPEIISAEVLKGSSTFQRRTTDGSIWNRATWAGSVSVTLRQLDIVHQQPSVHKFFNMDSLMREMDNLSVLRHSNIALLMAVCCGPNRFSMFLAMEPLQPSSLYQSLHKEHKKITDSNIARTMVGISSAVVYLHTVKGVAHNLLSSHAIYLTTSGNPKLCNVYCCYPPAIKIPGEHSSAMRAYLAWMAPELMHTRVSNFASDVYSLGVLLWELWGGEQPWPGLTPPDIGKVLVDQGHTLDITKKHLEISPILRCCFCLPLGRLAVEQFLSQVEYMYHKATSKVPH